MGSFDALAFGMSLFIGKTCYPAKYFGHYAPSVVFRGRAHFLLVWLRHCSDKIIFSEKLSHRCPADFFKELFPLKTTNKFFNLEWKGNDLR
jgi:hypothetical protein